MPSGAKKRKAAKKKKVNNSNNSTLSSTTTTQSHHGESDGGELSSPASLDHRDHQHQFTEGEDVEVEKREDNTSDHKERAIEETETASNEEKGDSQTNGVSKSENSKDSSSSSGSSSDSDDEPHAVEKNVVVVETVPVVESSQPVETMPEKIMHKIDEIAVETSIIVDPVKPDDSLTEGESQVDDVTKMEEKIDLIEQTSLSAELDKSSLEEEKVLGSDSVSKDNVSTSDVVVESVFRENHVTQLPSLDEKVSLESKDHVEASVHPNGAFSGVNGTGHDFESEKILVSEGALKVNCSTSDVVVESVMKENEVTQLPSLDEKDSSESKDHVAASSHPSESVSGVNGTGHAAESETPEYSERQPLVDSTPRAAQTTSWKSCCGIFELFSGSDR